MSQVFTLQIGESRFQVGGATFYKLNQGVFTAIEGGTYYADRDGDIFKYILKYLRHKKISFPNDFKDGELLMTEAKFYGLSDLKKHCEDGAGKPERVTLYIMTPKREADEIPAVGTDIFLSCETSPVNWETLLKGFKDELEIYDIQERIDVEVISTLTAEVTSEYGTTVGQELKKSGSNVLPQFAFNVKNVQAIITFINGFLSSGFSIRTDKSLSNFKTFGKTYLRVRELVFERIKPVN